MVFMSQNNIEGEKVLEKKLNAGVKNLGGLTFKFLPFLVAGIPDRICLLQGGKIFFAEIKTTKKTPEKLQKYWHLKLRKLGFRVEVIDTSEQIEKILKDYE